MSRKKFNLQILAMLFLLLVAIFFSLHIGTIETPFSTIPEAIGLKTPTTEVSTALTRLTVIKSIRVPRILAAVVCGAALAVSGAAYQSLFMNPIVSPGLLGVLAGAAFGASVGLLIGETFLFSQIFGFLSGLLAVGFAIFLSRLFPGNRLIMLLMGGIISSSLFTSLLSVVKYVADTQNKLPAIVYWLMGGFSAVSPQHAIYGLPLVVIGIFIIIAMSGYLNALSMGEEEALSLGVNTEKIRNLLILVTTLVCSITVVLGGMIGWVGLMIPHIARMIFGPDNRKVLPASALIGGLYLLLIDNLCRAAFASEIPIGIVTSLVGVPFFIFILGRSDRRWN